MIAIIDKSKCCGCGACAQACPRQCIAMKEDREGFLYPEADASRCIDCGEHDRACPILRADGAFVDGKSFDQPQARGGKHRDEAVRQASSGGGAFTLFADRIFAQYLESVERKAGSKIVSFGFREKDKGWQQSGLQLGTRAKFENETELQRYPALRDSYMNGFLEDIYLHPVAMNAVSRCPPSRPRISPSRISGASTGSCPG